MEADAVDSFASVAAIAAMILAGTLAVIQVETRAEAPVAVPAAVVVEAAAAAKTAIVTKSHRGVHPPNQSEIRAAP